MDVGLMLEGQNGLNWARWTRLLDAAESLGFQCVFRSDHYYNAAGPALDSLELWVSLTHAAAHTRRIEFGSLVAPTTFRHPAMTARMAAAVDDLSGGRLVLGLGAGWNEREHRAFGVPFYDKATRFAMFTEALELTTRLLRSDTPTTWKGEHFALEEALLLPRPRRSTPLLVGGNGMTRTLPLAAQYADEWNAVYLPPAQVSERNARLDDLLRARGRAPGDLKRSLMTGALWGETDAEVQRRAAERGTTPDALRERGVLVGGASAWVEQLGAFAGAGVQRMMIQWLDLDDLDGVEQIATTVLPQVKA